MQSLSLGFLFLDSAFFIGRSISFSAVTLDYVKACAIFALF